MSDIQLAVAVDFLAHREEEGKITFYGVPLKEFSAEQLRKIVEYLMGMLSPVGVSK